MPDRPKPLEPVRKPRPVSRGALSRLKDRRLAQLIRQLQAQAR